MKGGRGADSVLSSVYCGFGLLCPAGECCLHLSVCLVMGATWCYSCFDADGDQPVMVVLSFHLLWSISHA